MLKWNMLEKRQNISIVEIYAHENAEYVKCYNIEKADVSPKFKMFFA